MEKHSCSQPETSIETTFFGEDWDFSRAFEEQMQSFEKVLKNKGDSYILSGVHSSIFTLGNSLKGKSPVGGDGSGKFVQTDRGGRVMHHGPGQITIYPIFRINDYFKGPRDYTKFLFDFCIAHFKKNYALNLVCKNNGLWTEEGKKVGFVGLRIKEGICYHGLSLNYNVDLSAFLKHSPCDISGDQAGNLFSEHKKKMSLEAEALKLMRGLKAGLTMQRASLR